MTPRPFFSVIIPTYNRADLILKTLNSVFRQTFRDFEVIVIDNHSSDQTVSLLQPLAEAEKIRFIQHPQNYERAVSRNTGMDSAHGRFVTFLDSDDFMYPNNLEAAHAFAMGHPGTHVFHNLYELIDEEGKTIYRYPFPALDNPLKTIAEGNFMSCIGGFISEEVYRDYRFDTAEVLRGIEDWEFWIRVLAKYRVARIEEINSGIVHHQGRSITTFTLSGYMKKMDYVVNKIQSDVKLSVSYAQYVDAFRASCHLLVASMANSAGMFGTARAYLKDAILIKNSLLFNFRFQRILAKSFLGYRSRIDE